MVTIVQHKVNSKTKITAQYFHCRTLGQKELHMGKVFTAVSF